jgi:hypothetical protein
MSCDLSSIRQQTRRHSRQSATIPSYTVGYQSNKEHQYHHHLGSTTTTTPPPPKARQCNDNDEEVSWKQELRRKGLETRTCLESLVCFIYITFLEIGYERQPPPHDHSGARKWPKRLFNNINSLYVVWALGIFFINHGLRCRGGAKERAEDVVQNESCVSSLR